jgi:hypothetical protein
MANLGVPPGRSLWPSVVFAVRPVAGLRSGLTGIRNSVAGFEPAWYEMISPPGVAALLTGPSLNHPRRGGVGSRIEWVLRAPHEPGGDPGMVYLTLDSRGQLVREAVLNDRFKSLNPGVSPSSVGVTSLLP